MTRNLLKGGIKRSLGHSGDRSPPAGSRGRAPIRVWGLRPQKVASPPEAGDMLNIRLNKIYTNSTQQKQYTLKKIQLRRGWACTHAPLGYATVGWVGNWVG